MYGWSKAILLFYLQPIESITWFYACQIKEGGAAHGAWLLWSNSSMRSTAVYSLSELSKLDTSETILLKDGGTITSN